jgi:SAM-dependent methyltransferase
MIPPAAGLFLVVLFILDPFDWYLAEGITQGVSAFRDSLVWYQHLPAIKDFPYIRIPLIGFSLTVSFLLLAAIAWVFYPMGQRLGRWMDGHPKPIRAYSANIFGSLIGILLFNLCTIARTSPWLWFSISSVGFVWFLRYVDDRRMLRIAAAACYALLPVVLFLHSEPTTVWSPYQKLSLTNLHNPMRPDAGSLRCGKLINVNNVGYQSMIDLDRRRMRDHPELYPTHEVSNSHYILPYELIGAPGRVLVVGAGSGNDVSGALQAGATHVRAVEIDPVIIEWGARHHPNHPYDSDRVDVTVDDARAFFRREQDTYDLIWFGLLDSHTTSSVFSNVRLDNFVYTRESFAEMKRLLSPDGVVVLFFGITSKDPQSWWIADRLARLLGETFGAMPLGLDVKSTTPCLGWGGLMFIGGDPQVLSEILQRALARESIRTRLILPGTWPAATAPTSDDWPYVYLETPTIPKFHFLVGVVCLLFGFMFRRRLFLSESNINWPMLLLGAGFMLLEVSAVNRASLLFGTTWKVNAYVVGAVLSLILLANWLAARFRINILGWPIVGLIAALLTLSLLPVSWLAVLPFFLRILVGTLFLALPVLFSGVVFIILWSRTERKDLALGSNLLGSLVGGIASMLSMQIGFSALMWLVLAVYLVVILLIGRQGAAA